MNLLKNLKQLSLYKAKVFMLSGLVSLAAGCTKDNNINNEPDNTEPPAGQVDKFMKHIYDVPSAKFYEPGEPNLWYRFTKDANTTMVDGFVEVHGMDDMESQEQNDLSFKRVDEKSTNGVAQFRNEKYDLTINSKGAQIGLIYSDVGFIKSQVISTKNEATFTYAGGRPADIVNGDTEWDTKFVGTAYGYVDLRQNNKVIEQLFVSTDPATATIFIDKATQTETIVMPFKNWYRVTVVKTKDNKVTTKLDNDANKNIESKWVPPYYERTELYSEFVEQQNGVTIIKSSRVDSDVGIVSKFKSDYFGAGIKQEGIVYGIHVNQVNENIVRLNYVMGATRTNQK